MPAPPDPRPQIRDPRSAIVIKHVGKWTVGGRAVLLKFALRTDPDWRRHLRRSWRRRRYWVQGLGRRQAYRAQVLALIIEWHVRPARAARTAGGLKRGR